MTQLRLMVVIDGLAGGGTERSTVELLPALADRGIETTVLALRSHDEDPADEELNAVIEYIPETTFAGQVRSLRRYLRELRPDVVHSSLYRSNLVTRFGAAGRHPVVVSSLVNTPYERVRLDDPGFPPWKLRSVQIGDAITSRLLVDHFHAVSQAAADSAIRHLRIPPERISVVARGRDRSRLGEPGQARRRSARENLELSDGDAVILTVGRHSYQKGFSYLIETVRRLAADRPDVVCLIAGRPGPATSNLERLIREHQLGSRVRILGERGDVPDLLSAADVYVTTSLFEGMPGSVIEAMAMEVPVVGFDIAPVREVVGDDGALLCEPFDSQALSGEIERVLGDRRLAAGLAREGRRRYESNHTLDQSADGMVKLYRRLVG